MGGGVDGEARDLLETSCNDFIQEPRIVIITTLLFFTCNCLHPPLEKEPSNKCYYRLLSPYMNQHDIALHTRDDISLSLFWSLVLPLFKDLGRVLLHPEYGNPF